MTRLITETKKLTILYVAGLQYMRTKLWTLQFGGFNIGNKRESSFDFANNKR